MSHMGTKSDFAQKLLQDLRMRKEKMAVSQNSSSRTSSQPSRAGQGNLGRSSRSSRQINTLESSGTTIGNSSRRSNTSSRSMNTKESSNQLVLYDGRQTARQVRDLSMAIAFAFENTGNLSKITTSSSNPLINFFNRFNRRSTDGRNKTFTNSQFPNISHIHINEISKGVQKLNHILRASSNGLNFDRNSIEVGRELLKGAMNLEESLRMLVSLQEGSNMNRNQKKGRIKLLDEDDDDQDDTKTAEQWKLDRPRFSFDKPSRNSNVGNRRHQQLALPYSDESSKIVPHRRSSSSVQDLSLSTQEKGRISNVIAQLMGLEELPVKEYPISMQNDSKGKVLRRNTKSVEPLSRESRNGSSFITDKKAILPPTVKDPKKQGTVKSFENSIRKQNLTDNRESKMVVLKTELQQKAQNSRTLKAEEKAHNRTDGRVSETSMEKKKADKDFTRNLQKPHNQRALNQEQKDKHTQKQNLMPKKHEEGRLDPIISSKSKRSTSIMQKKSSQDKYLPSNGISTKYTEKVPMKDPPSRRQQDIEPSQENFKKEDPSHDSSPTITQFDVEKESDDKVVTKGKQTEVSAIQKKAIPRKVQRSETPQKIEILMSRRKATEDRLTRSIKQMHKKNPSLRKKEGKSDNSNKEKKAGLTLVNVSEMSNTPAKQLQKEADESQIEDTQNILILDDNCDAIALNSGKFSNDCQTMEQLDIKDDEEEEEKKQFDQTIAADNEEKTDLYNLSQNVHKQSPALQRQEQLTEPEKDLKETVIKSQQFLSTAEALFKLNIPVSFLHFADHNNEVSKKKLVLDSAYEVMKRKARRSEVTRHPFTKTTTNCTKLKSLDDLVKELCKDLEMLKLYGGNGNDVAAGLHEMLNKDIYDKEPDVNSMWDFEWSKMMTIFPEKEDVVRDVEKYMINSLLDEITNDLLLITLSV